MMNFRHLILAATVSTFSITFSVPTLAEIGDFPTPAGNSRCMNYDLEVDNEDLFKLPGQQRITRVCNSWS